MRRWPALAVSALFAIFVACSSAPSEIGSPDSGGSDDASVADVGSGEDGEGGGVDASGSVDGAPQDGGVPADAGDAGGDAGDSNACEWGGAPGECMTLPACAAIADAGSHTSYPNECPGPASIQCCIVTPSTALNPPTPAGWVLMQQAQVTTAMTNWAVAILNDPATYPMFSTTTMTFGTLLVLARVEWHPPDFQNGVVHRGVTLYEQAD